MASETAYGGRLAAALLRGCGRAVDAARDGLGDISRVAAFARGRLEFSPRPDDVYVATYPRSGTTWVLHMAHLLLRRGPEAEFEHLSEVCPWFERGLALGTFSAADLDALPSPRIFKSHLVPGWLPRAGRFLHVQRDLPDVAVSYFQFYRSHLGYEGTLEQFISRFLDGDVQYRAWRDHAAAWARVAGERAILHLRFEALGSDPGAALDRLAFFLGVAVDTDRRDLILERTSFAWMKAHEQRFDFAGEFLRQHGYSGGQFLRSGAVGQGRAQLPQDLQAELERHAARPARTGPEWRLHDFLR